jgi:outer membrane protein TolC
MQSVANNNTELKAQQQSQVAQAEGFNMGRELANPDVGIDYFIGSPSTAGNQTDIAITQPFDFPTTYKRKKELAESQTLGLTHQSNALKQNLMQEVKLICVEIVYQEKLKRQLIEQETNISSILETFEQKLAKGDGNGMDVSKAKLQLMQVSSDIQAVNTAIATLNQELTQLNGGIPLSFSDNNYFMNENTKSLEELQNTATVNNAILKGFNQNQEIANRQYALAKTANLPSLEAGYHYQGILGQTFQGVHFGFSIPLWESKNKIKYQKENILVNELYTLDYTNQVNSEITQHYQTYENYKKMMIQYDSFFKDANNLELLRKALDYGEMKAIEYFNEINFYNSSKVKYLETEKDMYLSIVKMTKYEE